MELLGSRRWRSGVLRRIGGRRRSRRRSRFLDRYGCRRALLLFGILYCPVCFRRGVSYYVLSKVLLDILFNHQVCLLSGVVSSITH